MQSLPQGATADTISLLLGHPDPSTLFTPEFQAAVERTLALPQALTALQYGNEQGNLDLIDYLVAKINHEQGLALTADHLMITAGATHAVDLVARLYGRPGGAVIAEAPTYTDSLHIFRDHGVELHTVPVDEQGARVDELEKLLKRLADTDNPARLFYTIPNFHNPTGVTLSASRRAKIVQLAKQYHLMLVEDDVYRDLAFETNVPPSLFALADGVDAIHIGSFSKTLAPGLRLGWLIASPETVQRFVNCGTSQMGGGASPFSAQIVADYCRSGCWEPHIERLRRLYQRRCQTMLAALENCMPEGVTWTKPNGGFFIWLTLPDGLQAREIKQRALQRGVLVAAGEGYFLDPVGGARHLRLTFSFAPPQHIETAVGILADVIRESR